jgi:hypothetical protein
MANARRMFRHLSVEDQSSANGYVDSGESEEGPCLESLSEDSETSFSRGFSFFSQSEESTGSYIRDEIVWSYYEECQYHGP